MTADWYYQQLGLDGELGPVSPSVLRSLIIEGIIGPESLVKKGRDGRWVPAKKVRGLFDGIAQEERPRLEAQPSRPLQQATARSVPASPPLSDMPPPFRGSTFAETESGQTNTDEIYEKPASQRLRDYFILGLGGVLLLGGFLTVVLVFVLKRNSSEANAVTRNHSPYQPPDANRVTAGQEQINKSAETSGRTDRRVMTTEEIVSKAEHSIASIKGKLGSGTGFLAQPRILATNAHVINSEFVENLEVVFASAPESGGVLLGLSPVQLLSRP